MGTGCTKPATQIVVLVESDLAVPLPLRSARAIVSTDTGERIGEHTFQLVGANEARAVGTFRLPVSFGVAPVAGDTEATIVVEVEARSESGRLFSRRAVTRFRKGKTLMLPILLASRCTTEPCATGKTCTENGCESELIDETTLREIEPGDETALATNPTPAPFDAGMVTARDAQPPFDGGSTMDARVFPDSGVIVDAIVRDAGAPCTQNLSEGDTCNPAQVACCGSDDVICRPDRLSNSTGECVKTCDARMNLQGSFVNADCAGIGRDCADFYGTGDATAACRNVVANFEEFGQRQLADCDPSGGSMMFAGPNRGGRVCFPVCTITTSPTNPRGFDCPGEYPVCSGNVFTRDGTGNEFAICARRVARGDYCELFKGLTCNTNDLCFLNNCHQRFGTVCTATTTCMDAREECLDYSRVRGLGREFIALCHQPCDISVAGACGGERACRPLAYGEGGNTGLTSCRARTATGRQGDDCADALGGAANASECDDGYFCTALSPDDFEASECRRICDSRNLGFDCPGLAPSCQRFSAPFTTEGVCF